MWYGVSAGRGRLAVDPRSGTPGGRIGRGAWIPPCSGLEASGEEYGRAQSGMGLEDDEEILGDWGRGGGIAREEWKCILGEEVPDTSM